MDIQIRKQLEQLEYIKDKLEYIEYDEALGCYIEKQDGLPTGVAAWVNGAFYGFEQAAKAQAVPGWISVEDSLPPVDETVLVCWDYATDIEPEKEYLTLDEDYNEYWPNCQDEPPTHWLPLPKVIKAQEPAND